MKAAAIVLLVLLVSGCATVTVKTETWEASYTRFWYDVEGFAVVGPKSEGWSAYVDRVTNDQDRLMGLVSDLIAYKQPKGFSDVLRERMQAK